MAAPKVGGPVRPNTSNIPKTTPALLSVFIKVSESDLLQSFIRVSHVR